jgi:hypothetical protein
MFNLEQATSVSQRRGKEAQSLEQGENPINKRSCFQTRTYFFSCQDPEINVLFLSVNQFSCSETLECRETSEAFSPAPVPLRLVTMCEQILYFHY